MTDVRSVDAHVCRRIAGAARAGACVSTTRVATACVAGAGISPTTTVIAAAATIGDDHATVVVIIIPRSAVGAVPRIGRAASCEKCAADDEMKPHVRSGRTDCAGVAPWTTTLW